MYFFFYFAMTGLHAIHMIIGMGLLLWLVLRARKGQLHAALFRAGGSRRPVLALRRYCVDFSVSVALLDRRALLMSQPIVPQKTYLLVFLGLIGLTVLTTGVAFIDLGPFNTVAALAIAFSKMLLVVLFFMGVRHSSGLVRIVLVAGFFWLALTDRLHHERLSHPLLDARAGFLVHDCSANASLALFGSAIVQIKDFSNVYASDARRRGMTCAYGYSTLLEYVTP